MSYTQIVQKSFVQTKFKTALGQMTAVSDEKFLYLLEFSERQNLDLELSRFDELGFGETSISEQIEAELADYFSGNLTEFKTPYKLSGTYFQKEVWKVVAEIPFGQTMSYKQIAEKIGRPRASIAVGAANAANQLAIIVPCHRLLRTNGNLANYAGGIWRKERLLKLEGIF